MNQCVIVTLFPYKSCIIFASQEIIRFINKTY